MEGRILFYDTSAGTGLVLDKQKQKYHFSIEQWEDFESLPDTGMEVVFELQGEQVCGVRTAALQGELEKEAEALFKEQDAAASFETAKEPERFDPAYYSVATVSETMLDQTISHYFDDLKFTVEKHKKEKAKPFERIDYFLIKRFLLTAYHNLLERDYALGDTQIASLLANIKEIEHTYELYKKSFLYPKLTFSAIFLKYTRYKDAKRRLEVNIIEMKSIKQELDKMELEIKTLTEKSKVNEKQHDAALQGELDEALRYNKGHYVDAVHRLGKLREENELLVPITDEYFEKFFDQFTRKFAQTYTQNITFLTELLDSLAYKLDKMIWAKARHSRPIVNFFKEADIKGDFNSLTYLRYFLRSLDKTKLTDENTKLYNLLQYLEKNYR